MRLSDFHAPVSVHEDDERDRVVDDEQDRRREMQEWQDIEIAKCCQFDRPWEGW
jgi:hypothetical protein